MKSLITFFAIFFAINVFGQTFSPIQPYRENDYTPSEVKNFALQSTSLSANFRRELVRLTNTALVSAGEQTVLTEANIVWILSHTRDTFVTLVNFTNSHRKVGGSEITFFNDKGFSGNVGIFSFGKCRVILYKSRCMNLLEIPVEKIAAPAPKQVAPPVEVRDTVYKTVVIEEEVVRRQRKSGYMIQGSYQTQGSYQVGGYCPPPVTYCAPPPQRYCPPSPRRYCPPPPPPPCVNKYYGHNRRGR